jgi:hypothetical protein
MASIVVYGFPGSTYIQIVRLVLTPFEYVPILRHGSSHCTRPAQSSATSMKGAVPFKNQFSRLRSVLSKTRS